MSGSSRIARTSRLFVDCEDCAEGPCVVTQVAVNVVMFADGTAEVVVSAAEDPARCIRRTLDEQTHVIMLRFLDMASLLRVIPTLPGD